MVSSLESCLECRLPSLDGGMYLSSYARLQLLTFGQSAVNSKKTECDDVEPKTNR